MSVPISLVAREAGGAVRHTFSPVDDKVDVAGQVHACTQVHGDAAPALELVCVRGTVWNTATRVVVVEAGGAGRVAVGLSTATQALAVATLALVCTCMLAAVWADWRRERERDGGRGHFG